MPILTDDQEKSFDQFEKIFWFSIKVIGGVGVGAVSVIYKAAIVRALQRITNGTATAADEEAARPALENPIGNQAIELMARHEQRHGRTDEARRLREFRERSPSPQREGDDPQEESSRG